MVAVIPFSFLALDCLVEACRQKAPIRNSRIWAIMGGDGYLAGSTWDIKWHVGVFFQIILQDILPASRRCFSHSRAVYASLSVWRKVENLPFRQRDCIYFDFLYIRTPFSENEYA